MMWNYSDKNWTQNGVECTYEDGADVMFGDIGHGNVQLEDTLSPASVLVENSAGHDYVWEGDGGLWVATNLTKNGEGKLTINTANSFIGTTVLNGGTLVLGNPQALGTPEPPLSPFYGDGINDHIQINNGTLDLGENAVDIGKVHIGANSNAKICNGNLHNSTQFEGEYTSSLIIDNVSNEWDDYELYSLSVSILNIGDVVVTNSSICQTASYSPFFICDCDNVRIEGCSLCDFVLGGNNNVLITGNYGGIMIHDIRGSNTVFRGNYFQRGDETNLFSISSGGIYDAFIIDRNCTFYDAAQLHSLYVVCGGNVTFSGKYAEEDLSAIKANYSRSELDASLTTIAYGETHLEYGATMSIEDGAVFRSLEGISATGAELRLANGTIEVEDGYSVKIAGDAGLDLAGENNITATSLEFADGAYLTFNIDSQEGSLLNLDAVLQTGVINVVLSGDLTEAHSLISLHDAAQYDTSLWTSGDVTVVGTTFDHLIWEQGILTYTPITPQHIVLNNDTEIEDFGDDKRVDIEGNSHKLTVKHPVDLVHLAMENGVVKLEGADNNVVRITLTEDGTLQLAAGAGLNVGNIVSMVANGSADLVISGDIEINDIKAYGKPGNKGTLSYVNMTTADDYTIENMTISGSLIDVGEGTTLYLVDVDIKSDTHITDDPASVFVQGTHAQLDETNTWVDKEITTAKDTTLYLCGNTSKSITLAAGTDIVELTSDMFDTVTLTGTDLWLDMTGIAEATYGKDYFTLDFQDFAREMAKAQVDVENLRVYATLDGERYTEAYSTANGGLTTTLYFQVPEPATSTLSLLALAALTARRRRK